ncbi:DUF3466 family protein [Aliikangiella sp. IMCC44632]
MIKLKKTFITSFLVCASLNLSAADSYEIIDLGELDDVTTFAFGINNSNVAVGFSQKLSSIYNREAPHFGFYYQNGLISAVSALPSDGDQMSALTAINNNGLAAGFSIVGETNSDGVVQYRESAIYFDTSDETLYPIPKIAGDVGSTTRALSLNDNGVIVGFTQFNPDDDTLSDGTAAEAYNDRGFIYDTVSGEINRVDPINYANNRLNVVLRDINNNNRAVGYSGKDIEDFGVVLKSFYVDSANPEDLVELPLTIDNRPSQPFAINDLNMVAGKRILDEELFYSAFLYDINSQVITDIEPLNPGYKPQRGSGVSDISVAFDVNNQGQAVGKSLVEVAPYRFHAFLFENNQTKNLNDLIDCKVDTSETPTGNPDWVLYEATRINDNGVIVGNGFLNSVRKSFMLIPRPNTPVTPCQDAAESDSGSGSVGIWGLILLAFGGVLRRAKTK